MNPHDIQMEDSLNFFCDTTTNVANMRYLNVQQIALDHRMELREIHDDDEVPSETYCNA
jgi:hypothetical protein